MKKYGKVVILGRPNTGKSTLLNSIMNQKVAITSPLPQTTRKSNRTVYSDNRGTIFFTDTPGIINKVNDLVGKMVNAEAPKEAGGADVVVCLVDISRPKSEEENKVIGIIRKLTVPKILVYNKIDQAVGAKDHLAEYNYLEDEFDKVIAVSAIKEKNVKALIEIIFEFLREGEPPKLTNLQGPVIGMGSKEYIAEVIREKAYLGLREEVPYSLTVEVDEIKDKGNIVVIKARILTTADRYKKMIIGKDGKKNRQIGHDSRKEFEIMSGRKIYLELVVEVDKHWPERVLTGN